MTKQYIFSDIFSEYHFKIVSYLRKMLGENHAEDASQIVFEKISRNLPSFKGESKLSTWIYKIATNTALDILRSPAYKNSIKPHVANYPDLPETVCPTNPGIISKPISPDQQLVKNEMNDCIREFIDRLPPDYRVIITLNELKGFTNKEISEILDISPGAAKIRLHRARAKLKKELEAGCTFYHNDQNELSCDRKQTDPE